MNIHLNITEMIEFSGIQSFHVPTEPRYFIYDDVTFIAAHFDSVEMQLHILEVCEELNVIESHKLSESEIAYILSHTKHELYHLLNDNILKKRSSSLSKNDFIEAYNRVKDKHNYLLNI